MKYFTALLALVLTLACDNPMNVMGPTPTPAPPPLEIEAPAPLPVNRGVEFSWDNPRGILLFAGTQGTEGNIQALDSRLRSLGWPTPTYNVCSETAEWEGTPWNDGPPPFSVENLENLQRFLATTAELGSQVYLNIFCTIRDNKSWMQNNAQRYTETVVDIAKEFDHVYLSIGNEVWHPASKYLRSGSHVRDVRNWARSAGWMANIGTDDNLGCPGCSFAYSYRSLGFIPNFHPYRNPDPNGRALDRLVEENGLPLIISEPTAYSSWREGGCCTSNRNQIVDYMNRAERRGIVWFFHSTDGLQWPNVTFEWIPS